MMKLVVLCCVLAVAAGSAILPFAPLAYTASILQPYNYRGPLSLAPGQPANILGADGRPLDTLDVNLDRSAHFTAKALSGVQPIHLLKKRSAPVIAQVVSPYIAHASPLAYSTPIVTPHFAAPLTYSSPIIRYY